MSIKARFAAIMSVILETSLGDITVDLYTDERPRSCLNFLKLCKMKYYNFCLFHSVQRNLVAQTGDPEGTSRGGESVFRHLYGDQAAFFEMELKPRIKHKKFGALSMVNNGENLHGSQFFITLAPNIDYLDNKHTVFGEVAEGFDVLKKFNDVFVDGENRPYKDVRIYHTVVLDDPFDDPPGLAALIPDRSPEPTKEQLDSGRIGAEEDIDDTKGLKPAEIDEKIKEQEAKANAQLLQMIGDLPDVDVKPPDNVLFVCKLNPVTTEDDLEVIFSRFGNIASCEVIKDQKTGESLQYAFVEFEKPEDCESAFFKMDNVLIDDRRIHVDFSQSVAKVKWKGKGKGVEHAKPEKEAIRESYRIKDKDRQNDNYSFVFDDDTDVSSAGKRTKSRDLSGRDRRTDNSENKYSEKPARRRSRSRSNSVPKSGHKSTSSQEAKHRQKKRSRSRDTSSEHRRHARTTATARNDGDKDRKHTSKNDRQRSRSRDRSTSDRERNVKSRGDRHDREGSGRKHGHDDDRGHGREEAHSHKHKRRSRSRSGSTDAVDRKKHGKQSRRDDAHSYR